MFGEFISPHLALSLFAPETQPFVIFFARICDVSIGTLRIMMVSRGLRVFSAILGFFEIFIWLLAISQIVSNLGHITNYIAYASGFACGTWLGMTFERWLSMGTLLVRAIVPRSGGDLVAYLIMKNYKVTYVDGHGAKGPVTVIFTIVKRKLLPDVIATIKKFDPEAFYSVEDVKAVNEPMSGDNRVGLLSNPFGLPFWRKGKQQ